MIFVNSGVIYLVEEIFVYRVEKGKIDRSRVFAQ